LVVSALQLAIDGIVGEGAMQTAKSWNFEVEGREHLTVIILREMDRRRVNWLDVVQIVNEFHRLLLQGVRLSQALGGLLWRCGVLLAAILS